MLTLYEAAKRSRNPLAAGMLKAIVTEDELFSLLMMVPKAGDSFMYVREKALPTVEWVARDGSTTLVESHATTDQVTVPKARIGSLVDVDNFAEDQQTEGGSPTSMQIEKKAKATGRTIADALINGGYVTSHALGSVADPFAALSAFVYGPHLNSDSFGPGEIRYTHAGQGWQFRAPGDRDFGTVVPATGNGTYVLKSDNPSKWIQVVITVASATGNGTTRITFASTSNHPDGVKKLCAPSQVIASTGAAGDDLSFETLDKLMDLVKVRQNMAFFMPSALIRKYKSLLRGLGGTTPEHVVVPSFNAEGAMVERKVLAYNGVPILKNDFVTTNESKGGTTTLSSVYCASLTPDEGLYAGCFGGASFQVDADPRARIVLGFRLRQVGELETKDAQRYKVTAYLAFALGSELALARASEIKSV